MTTHAVTVRFEQPAPPVPRRAESLTAFAAALKARPGIWALLGTGTTPGATRQYAYEIRHASGTLPGSCFAPAGAFEAETRTVMGERRVYVRYVGEDGAR